VEEVGVGGVVREFFEWAFVWGDVLEKNIYYNCPNCRKKK
jgi:hypothetical protein